MLARHSIEGLHLIPAASRLAVRRYSSPPERTIFDQYLEKVRTSGCLSIDDAEGKSLAAARSFRR